MKKSMNLFDLLKKVKSQREEMNKGNKVISNEKTYTKSISYNPSIIRSIHREDITHQTLLWDQNTLLLPTIPFITSSI